MKDFKYIWLLLLLILNSFGACSDDDPLMPGERPSSGTDPAPEEQVLHDGFNFDPAIPKADEPLICSSSVLKKENTSDSTIHV